MDVISSEEVLFLKVTEKVKRKWDLVSYYYDIYESLLEKLVLSKWRNKVFEYLDGEEILEVGVGTGKNFDFYPSGKKFMAIDFSPGMLKRARRKAEIKRISVDLREMDIQRLQFDDQSFDTVVGTFVFCSVPDPVQGLKEVRRVCKKGGRVILLEHVRPNGRFLGKIFDILNLLTVRLMGVNINRETVRNIKIAGLGVEKEMDLFKSVVKMVIASP